MKRAIWALALGLMAFTAAAENATPTTYTVAARYALGGSGKWDYLTFNPSNRRLYIARMNRVMVVDTTSGKLVQEIAGAVGAHRVVIVEAQGRGYVSNGHADSVMPFDLATGKTLQAIALSGKDPDAMLYDTVSKQLWAFNGHSDNASLIDPVAGKETATVALPGKPEFAVTDDSGHIYVNLEDKSAIADIDVTARKVLHVWPLAPCEGPTGLAIDVSHHRLFSACANRTMAILDANDGHVVTSVTIGDDPDAAGYDAGNQMVFSSNADGSLTVIHQNDPNHYSVVSNLSTAKSARTLAIDPVTHHVLLVAPDVGVAPASAPNGTFGVLVVAPVLGK